MRARIMETRFLLIVFQGYRVMVNTTTDEHHHQRDRPGDQCDTP